jgi:hypothetical protein
VTGAQRRAGAEHSIVCGHEPGGEQRRRSHRDSDLADEPEPDDPMELPPETPHGDSITCQTGPRMLLSWGDLRCLCQRT